MIRIFYIFLFSAFIFSNNVKVEVDREQINENDSVTLTISSQNSKDAPNISLSDLKDFNIISGPNESSSSNYSIINGKISTNSSYSISWTLVPKRIGKLIIPSFDVIVDGQISKSKPIYVNVLIRDSRSIKNSQFFIEASVDNNNPYRGEQLVLTYTLYTRVDITSFDEKIPRFKGFWVEDLYTPKKLQLRKVQKYGREYHSAIIKKVALFPTKSGKNVIEPMTATIGVRDGKRNSFSVFEPTKEYIIATGSIDLIVRALPKSDDGKISTVVGEWDIKSTVDRKNIIKDEAINIKVHLVGKGNVKSVDILPYKFPESFEAFEPKITTKKSISQTKIGGEKIVEYVLIPRSAGEFYLPSFEIKYFDSKVNKWLVKKTKEIKLFVNKNKKIESMVGLLKEEVQLVGKDIRFMDQSIPNWKKNNSDFFDKITIVLIIIIVLLLLLPSIVFMHQSYLKNTTDNRKFKKALKNSLAIIKSINEPAPQVYASIHQSIINYINDKTGMKSLEYSTSEIISTFENNSLSSDSVNSLKKIIERGEAVRYASISEVDINNDIIEIKLILKEADNGWI